MFLFCGAIFRVMFAFLSRKLFKISFSVWKDFADVRMKNSSCCLYLYNFNMIELGWTAKKDVYAILKDFYNFRKIWYFDIFFYL